MLTVGDEAEMEDSALLEKFGEGGEEGGGSESHPPNTKMNKRHRRHARPDGQDRLKEE